MTHLPHLRACTISECTRPYYAKGYCATHYRRLQRGADLLRSVASKQEGTCAMSGCTGRPRARQLCAYHYQALWRRGELPITETSSRWHVKGELHIDLGARKGIQCQPIDTHVYADSYRDALIAARREITHKRGEWDPDTLICERSFS